LRGGFIGVDIFFVLSGFLITTLLLEERQTRATIRVGAFYRRRALRLLPALVAFLALHVMFVTVVLDNPIIVERRWIPSALLFATNWSAIATQPPLAFGHLWSLAVEEQFYLLWPFAMIVIGTRGRSRSVLATLAAAIAVIGIWRWLLWDATSVARVVLGTDTHADGLMFGALLAQLRLWRPEIVRVPGLVVVSAAAFLGACAVIVEPGSAFLFQGGYTLIAAAAALVVAGVAAGDHLATRALARTPLLAIGRVSYGLYLWHPLVFWWVFVELRTAPDSVRLLVGLAATAAVTAVSWYLIERPFLQWKARLEQGATTAETGRRTPLDTAPVRTAEPAR
jgi:peptidoglycan/LPS O-acetylase OafA/YrhL